MIYDTGASFEEICNSLHCQLLDHGEDVEVGEWQAIRDPDFPLTKTRELLNVSFCIPIPETVSALQNVIRPNLPWAEDHFQERVEGEPLNPGVQYKNWPYYHGNVERHQTQEEEKFSHTYMERMWPKQAGRFSKRGLPHIGIRFAYGDLNDVVQQLSRSPYTRQAYLPIWFPEDTGAVHRERVPCTLGYHFLIRQGRIHITYYIRSCDFLRHFRDDVYLTARLCQWVGNQLLSSGLDIHPGNLVMHMSSFHVFQGDLPKLERERPDVHG